MTNHEKLQEKYEDSLFALLMDEFAQSEGERLIQENERLLQDPSAEVPAGSERRLLQTIERETARVAHKRSGKNLLRFLGHLALAALIAVLLFGSAFALSPAFRAGTLNLLMQIDDRVASWELLPEINDNPAQNGFPLDVEIGWLPEGYVKNEPVYSSEFSLFIKCTNNSGGSIDISIESDTGTFFTFDIENAEFYNELSIQNSLGIMIVKDDWYRIAWKDEDTKCNIMIQSADVDAEALLSIAESIILV